MLEFEEYLDNALRSEVWILDGAVWRWELDSEILVCPFQIRIFKGKRNSIMCSANLFFSVDLILYHIFTLDDT